MIIIHHMNENTLPRLAAGALRERLRVMPAVIVSGARQAGKSTLVQEPWQGSGTMPRSTISMSATSSGATQWRWLAGRRA